MDVFLPIVDFSVFFVNPDSRKDNKVFLIDNINTSQIGEAHDLFT